MTDDKYRIKRDMEYPKIRYQLECRIYLLHRDEDEKNYYSKSKESL